MKNILILTDFSSTAQNAALYALDMFKSDPNVVYKLLNAYDLEFSGSPYVMQVKEEMTFESKKGLKQELKVLNKAFPLADIETLSTFGSLIDVVHEYINKHQPHLIILGCRGESALENFLLGSNAYEVLKNVKSPLMVIPKSATFKEPQKIVFATDLKEIKDRKVTSSIRDLVDRFDSKLVCVNVLDTDYVNRMEAESKLKSHFPNTDVSFNFIHGDDVSKTIFKFMEENGAEIVAVVRRDVSFFDRIFHPSITKRMVMQPEYPMLILHDEGL